MEEIIKILPKYRVKNKKQHRTGGRQKKTPEQYIEELKIKNPNVVAVENYIGVNTKIKHKCSIHNIIWEITPHNALNGQGCKKCKIEKYHNSRVKDTDLYISQVQSVSPHIIVKESYIDAKTPILHECTIHKIKWYATPDNILTGKSCKLCGKEKTIKGETLTNGEYLERVTKCNPNVQPLESYINMKTHILHLYKLCGHITKVAPLNILQGNGCRQCVGKTIGLAIMNTHEEFINRVSLINPNIEIIGRYTGANNAIKCKCNLCGHTWSPKATSLLSGYGCPKCRKSKGEERISAFLDTNNITYEIYYIYDELVGIGGKPLSYDFYLPTYNTLIEFQGIQHEKPVCFGGISENKALLNFKIQQEHDRRKRNYAKTHNINLLEIWYYDINNIETIIKQYLHNLKLEIVMATGVA